MNNFTLSHKTYTGLQDIQRKRLNNIVDTTALYEAIYVADKFFPEQWSKIKNNFSYKLDGKNIRFVGMGIEKDLSIRAEDHPDINFKIYGRCLNFANQMASSLTDMVFIVPGSQKIANSVIIDDFENVMHDHGADTGSLTSSKRTRVLHQEHRLVHECKQLFEKILDNDTDNELVDSRDLIYQCLFRLMFFDPKEYCVGDVQIKRFYGISYHESASPRIKRTLFMDIYREQKEVLLHEYYRKEKKLFQDLNSSLARRGKLKMIKSDPYMILKGGYQIPLELREVDVTLANRIHRSFHYIHTPRNSGHVLGLFAKGNKLPISVIGIEKVDRAYKKSALLNYNISPDHTYELTRMYSCKNSPANTSSFMLAITNSYLKNADSSWQASISSFMPSYATGLSMVGGGFKDVLYAKECTHNYEVSDGDRIAVKTNRSTHGKEFLTNRTKVMPVLELIHTRKSFLNSLRNDPEVFTINSPGAN